MLRLKEVMVSRGGTIDPSRFADERFTLYSIPAFDRGTPDSVLGAEIGSSKQVVSPGDVLLSKIVPHIRRAWVVSDGHADRVIASGEWIVFRGEKLHPPYLRQILLSDPFHRRFMETVAGVGGSLMRARPAHVADISVPFPPLAEQRRLAVVLDQVDTLRGKRREAIALLDDLAQAIFLDMFDPEDTGTPVVSIDELCSLVVDCVNRTAPVVDRATPFKMIRTTNVKNGRVDLRVTRYVEEDVFRRWNRRATPRRGDVLLTREAPVGEVGVLATDDHVFLGQRLMLYRVDPDRATPEYLSAALRSPYLKGQYERSGSGSTVKHLSLPTCRSLRVPAPDVSAQRQFAARIAKLDELKADHNRHLVALDELFGSLQQRAFAGRLRNHEAA